MDTLGLTIHEVHLVLQFGYDSLWQLTVTIACLGGAFFVLVILNDPQTTSWHKSSSS